MIDRLIDLGALPEPENGEYTVRWQSLSDPGEREQAETALAWGKATQAFEASKSIIAPAEARERFLGLDANAPEPQDIDGQDLTATEDDDAEPDEAGSES